MGWSKNNLSENDRENIARSLFTTEERKNSKGWLNGKCPLHEDGNPSFGYNVDEDVFHCHSGCSKDGDLIDLFCRVNSLSAADGFIQFKKRFAGDLADEAISKPAVKNKKDKKPAADKSQMRRGFESWELLPDSWIARLTEVRGWSKEVIQAIGMRKQGQYRCKNSGALRPVSEKHARVAIPVMDKDGTLQNIRLYMPGAETAKIISWGTGTGESRLFPRPDPLKSDEIAWICEGEADTLCARSLGLDAFTQTAKLIRWPEDHLLPFTDRDVVICYDADDPGAHYAEAAATCLSSVATSVRLIEWPAFMMDEEGKLPKKHGQDLTDYILKHGKNRTDLENLLPGAKEIRKEDVNMAWQFFGQTMSGRDSFQPRLLADRLMRDVELLSDPATGLLYRWNGQCYERFERDSLKRRAINYLGTESVSNRYEDAVKQACLLATVPDDRQVDDQHNLLCLQNGMFDINTFELFPHDKKYLSTIQIGVEYDPENPADCPRWKQFLKETIQTDAVIDQMQEYFGLCLTREVRYEMCLIMIGDGGDGKSTAQKVLRAMVGEESCSSISFDAFEDQFQRSMIYNRMVNIASEIGSKAMDSDYFKRIVSGDEISASFKHKDGFSFKPFCKLVFAVNRMPKVLDTTDGLYRRLLPVWFKRQFLPGDPSRDPYLEEKLLAELPGIFGWALLGLHRLKKRGDFDVNVPETQKLLSEYRKANDPVFIFVNECCEIGNTADVTAKTDLYKAYKSYCGKNGFKQKHSQNFFADLRVTSKALKQEIKPTRPSDTLTGERVRSFAGIKLTIQVPEDE